MSKGRLETSLQASQFVAQCIGVLTNVVVIGILGFITFKVNDLIFGLRTARANEAAGLDLPEMGVPGYVGVTDGLAMPEFTRSQQESATLLRAESR